MDVICSSAFGVNVHSLQQVRFQFNALNCRCFIDFYVGEGTGSCEKIKRTDESKFLGIHYLCNK